MPVNSWKDLADKGTSKEKVRNPLQKYFNDLRDMQSEILNLKKQIESTTDIEEKNRLAERAMILKEKSKELYDKVSEIPFGVDENYSSKELRRLNSDLSLRQERINNEKFFTKTLKETDYRVKQNLRDFPSPLTFELTDENGNPTGEKITEPDEVRTRRWLRDEVLRLIRQRKGKEIISEENILGEPSDIETKAVNKIIDHLENLGGELPEDKELKSRVQDLDTDFSLPKQKTEQVLASEFNPTDEEIVLEKSLKKPFSKEEVESFMDEEDMQKFFDSVREKSSRNLSKAEQEEDKKLSQMVGGLANRGSWNSGTRQVMSKEHVEKQADRRKDLETELAELEVKSRLGNRENSSQRALQARKMAQDFYDSMRKQKLLENNTNRNNALSASNQLANLKEQEAARKERNLVQNQDIQSRVNNRRSEALSTNLNLGKVQTQNEQKKRAASAHDRINAMNRGLNNVSLINEHLRGIQPMGVAPYGGANFVPGHIPQSQILPAEIRSANLLKDMSNPQAPQQGFDWGKALGGAAELVGKFIG